MSLVDNEKNRKLLKFTTQEEWDKLTPNEQYSRYKLKDKIGDNTLLQNIVYNKADISRRRKSYKKIEVKMNKLSNQTSKMNPQKCDLTEVHSRLIDEEKSIEFICEHLKLLGASQVIKNQKHKEKVNKYKKELDENRELILDYLDQIEYSEKYVDKKDKKIHKLKKEISTLTDVNDELHNKILELENFIAESFSEMQAMVSKIRESSRENFTS